EAPAIEGRCQAGLALEQGAKERRVLVADGPADLLHGDVSLFEQARRRAPAEALQILDRREPRRGLEAADEVARAHAELARERVEAHLVAAVAVGAGRRRPDRRVCCAG